MPGDITRMWKYHKGSCTPRRTLMDSKKNIAEQLSSKFAFLLPSGRPGISEVQARRTSLIYRSSLVLYPPIAGRFSDPSGTPSRSLLVPETLGHRPWSRAKAGAESFPRLLFYPFVLSPPSPFSPIPTTFLNAAAPAPHYLQYTDLR